MEKSSFYENLMGGNIWEIHALILLPVVAAIYKIHELGPWILFLFGITILPTPITFAFVLAGAQKWYNLPSSRNQAPPYQSITNFKSLMMIMTILCILAVDFQVFERRYAKTESYGTSLMDIGVGTFIYSGGLMFGLRKSNNVKDTFQKAIPVWILGIGRLAAVRLSGYHEHVSEYGVHWNFFLTLGTIPIISSLIQKCTNSLALTGYFVAVFYQVALHFGLSDYIFFSKRDNLFSQNREGILSCIGYTALWLLAADFSKYLNRPNLPKIILVRLVINSALYFVDSVSRRACNLPFIAWVCSVSDIFLYILHSKDIPTSGLLQKINKYLLPLFLIANLLTGLINLGIDTINVSNIGAIFILLNYSLFISILAWLFDMLK
eukprot:NODE_218_length_12464_cov_0.653781.p3 type:complete len:379 gc:universal NODE_218_length_12464_cov_0.653781:4159-3023(-)